MNIKKLITVGLAVTVAMLQWVAGADITVSDVKVFSGYPWREVAIGYTIRGNSESKVFWIQVSAKDNKNGKTHCKFLGGASATEGKHVIKWNAAADGVKFKSDDVVFTVEVIDLPLYYVIDLSGGASANHYPVTELADVPSGGWTDEYKTTKLVMRRIDAGTYKMQNKSDVTLTKPFYIGVFEVTQKQWELVMGSNPCSSSRYGKGSKYPVYYISYDMIRGASVGAGWPGSTAVDSTSFIGKLRTKTDVAFDLPTEAQWEYACRAGTATTYYWGNSMNGDYVWYSSNSGGTSHPVGSKKPNAWGLYDMSGNVWEWCLDWYGTLSYGVDPKGLSSGSDRVNRGGMWYYDANICASSYRSRNKPVYSSDDYGIGFRLSFVAW